MPKINLLNSGQGLIGVNYQNNMNEEDSQSKLIVSIVCGVVGIFIIICLIIYKIKTLYK